jgi:hypothetical protein
LPSPTTTLAARFAKRPPAGLRSVFCTNAHAEIAELARFVGGVPALHNAVEFLRPLVRHVVLEPRRLDHAAALWCRGLLVLAGEIVFADVRRICSIISGGSRA